MNKNPNVRLARRRRPPDPLRIPGDAGVMPDVRPGAAFVRAQSADLLEPAGLADKGISRFTAARPNGSYTQGVFDCGRDSPVAPEIFPTVQDATSKPADLGPSHRSH